MVTIVVVEPDFAIRTLFAEWLFADGYTVRPFGHWVPGHSALASADVLLVDLPSPRVPPHFPLAHMHANHAGLVAIGLSSGLSASLGGESAFARSLGLAAVLAKPCERRELLDAVRHALSRHAA